MYLPNFNIIAPVRAASGFRGGLNADPVSPADHISTAKSTLGAISNLIISFRGSSYAEQIAACQSGLLPEQIKSGRDDIVVRMRQMCMYVCVCVYACTL